ncbi:MAG: PBP1A family penicillin-binding protein [Treponema sp.]|nr:PBP1A family penicillin-binding protein [Treponema sp.]
MAKSGLPIIVSIVIRLLAILTVCVAVVMGIALGWTLAETTNIKNQENFEDFAPALPTKIMDMDGNVVTEFSADEKRELISLNELPKHLIYAVLAREDPDFYNHKGFSIRGIARAAFGKLIGKDLGGGSTITQQVAGTLYSDRSEITITRKIKELWWAIQMERRYTKNEILEIYLNYMIMGPGTYGVEAASKYFFGHSAREITLAESAILVVQLSSPTKFNPLNNPNLARSRQIAVLDKMVELGYTTREEADQSFNDYWDNYDYTRVSTAAYYYRDDAAPWFSEYVRRELDGMMYGTMDYYRDGYVVHTTLNLKHQDAAEKYMQQGLERANTEYSKSADTSNIQAERTYVPIVELLSLAFNLESVNATASSQNEQKAMARYTKVINPVIDIAALMFGVSDLKPLTNTGFAALKTNTEQNVVEGALITIENETGYITAIIGGSKYDESNQLIRATQGNLQPGSAFKPLYYSAAMDSRKLNPASLITDVPIVFYNEDGTPYLPLNFRGEWKGTVLLYDALAESMNVPSLKVLDTIGFDAAIDRAAALLGYTNPDTIRRIFPRVYPLGLGIISTSPLRMARAFAIFANQGRDVTPIAIRSVEDRNGKVVLYPEQDLRQNQRKMGSAIQVISPQNAYVMTSMLKKTVEMGTLYNPSGWLSKFMFYDENGKRFRMPMAGKTGTPQNWSDAWTIGYSPYYTTAVWFGFDKPGNSLGTALTGSTLAGPVWADYMREIHQGLPYKDFVRPSTGLVDVTVCAKSGLLKTAACNEGEVTLTFLEGTQPVLPCNIHGNTGSLESTLSTQFSTDTINIDQNSLLWDIPMPKLPAEFSDTRPANTRTNTGSANSGSVISRPGSAPSASNAPNTGTADTTTGPGVPPGAPPTLDIPDNGSGDESNPYYGIEAPDYNPLLD